MTQDLPLFPFPFHFQLFFSKLVLVLLINMMYLFYFFYKLMYFIYKIFKIREERIFSNTILSKNVL